MSVKMHNNSSTKLNNSNDHHQWVKTSSVDSSVKLAGDEAKDRLYEAKDKKKLVRVLTVVAYVFFVSLAAIMLSLYYLFLWNDNQKDAANSRYNYQAQHTSSGCSNGENVLVDVAYEPTAIPVVEANNKDLPPMTPSPMVVVTSGITDIAPVFDNNSPTEDVVSDVVITDDDNDDDEKQQADKLGNLSKRSLFFKKLLSRNLLD